MSKMNSKFKYMFDAAPAATLVEKDGVAKTATFNGNALALDKLDGYWNKAGNGILADTTFAVAVNVTALDKTTGDEVYTLELEFGNGGFATSVKTHKAVVNAAGQYVFLVDADTVKALLAGVTQFRVVGTLAGTTPSITLHAWVAGAIQR